MSVHTANSQFSFQLPSMSYVDARWEEPSLGEPAVMARKARRGGLAAWLSRRIAALVAWHRHNVAAAELASMTDYELQDIGLSRADLVRVFDPSHNADLRQRNAAGQG
jgi:uncharacterized protein YjiS (DUF1127 family)